MGILQTEERKRAEIEEFRHMVQAACAAVHRRKDEEELRGLPMGLGDVEGGGGGEEKVVCVTSGVSYLGRAIVNRLLLRGYSVRIMVDNQEDLEKLREMETSGEMGTTEEYNFRAVVAKMTDVDSLSEAFHGCHGVFHTAALVDPSGLSGYSKCMAEIEAKATENVMEACGRTPSVRKCVLTSSLLACVWRDHSPESQSLVLNQDSWSDESFCLHNKLWYALGKVRGEKAAWRIAEEWGSKLKLTSICSALVTGPQFCIRNPTPTIAYLKGAKEMYSDGLLASVDVMNVAEAHVRVYEAMNKTASGRYICYDQLIDTSEKATKLAQDIGMPSHKICASDESEFRPRFQLSNRKLSSLLSTPFRCRYEDNILLSDVHKFCK